MNEEIPKPAQRHSLARSAIVLAVGHGILWGEFGCGHFSIGISFVSMAAAKKVENNAGDCQ